MSENTKIQWCDHTFNPWEGCAKVSPGCANCYAENRNARFNGGESVNWGRGAPRRRTSAANWKLPLRWNAGGEVCVDCGGYRGEDQECECGQIGAIGKTRRARVFCSSLADWLDDEVPVEWLADLLTLIHGTPNLDWLMLTKRPENWKDRLGLACDLNDAGVPICRYDVYDWIMRWRNRGKFPNNVWIGTSVEDQKRADERIPELLKIPASVRFLSVEPMLESIDLKYACFNGADSFGTMPGIDWAIFGGESGPGARPCNLEWISDGVKQCVEAGVAPFVKQLGGKPWVDNANNYDWPDDWGIRIDGGDDSFAAGWVKFADKKGGDWNEWPLDLRMREWPKTEDAK